MLCKSDMDDGSRSRPRCGRDTVLVFYFISGRNSVSGLEGRLHCAAAISWEPHINFWKLTNIAAAAAPPLKVIGGRFLDRAAVSLLDAPELLKIRLIVMPPTRDDFGIENDAAFGVDRRVGGPYI
jgi:hypothetical protein